MTTATQIAKFEIGKTYFCRSICDYDFIRDYTVVRRTASTVTMSNGKTYRINKQLTAIRNAESFFPLGNYSMAPILSADKVA